MVPSLQLVRGFRRCVSVAILSLGFFAVGSSSPVLASGNTAVAEPATVLIPGAATSNDVLAKLAEKNRLLSAYQAQVRVEFKLRSFPFVREHLDGTAYFKRPSRYDVVFKHVPGYAKGFSHLSADLADPGSWDRRFYVSMAGTRTVNGHRDLILRLVQRVRGQIDHQDVAVNPLLWEVDAMEYHYYNGGTIAMQQHFETIGGFRLITALDAQIQIPFVKALAHADYTNYRMTVAMSPSSGELSDGH